MAFERNFLKGSFEYLSKPHLKNRNSHIDFDEFNLWFVVPVYEGKSGGDILTFFYVDEKNKSFHIAKQVTFGSDESHTEHEVGVNANAWANRKTASFFYTIRRGDGTTSFSESLSLPVKARFLAPYLNDGGFEISSEDEFAILLVSKWRNISYRNIVTLNWVGLSSSNREYKYIQSLEFPSNNDVLSFQIPSEQLKPLSGGSATVSYNEEAYGIESDQFFINVT